MYLTVGTHLLWKSCEVRPVSKASWNRGFCSPVFCYVMRILYQQNAVTPTNRRKTTDRMGNHTNHSAEQ